MPKEPSDLVKFKSKLHAGEEINSFAPGYVGEMMGTGKKRLINGVLVLTNQRVVFYSKSFFGEVEDSMSLDKISAVETGDIGLIQCVKIHISENTFVFKANNPPEASTMTEKILLSLRALKKTSQVA